MTEKPQGQPMPKVQREIMKFAFGCLSPIACFYAVWQGPFHGKWAEAAFFMGLSISLEMSFRSLWGKDE